MNDKYSKYGYLFILPFFLVFITFHVYPIFYTFYLSLTNFNGYKPPEFVGISNYIEVLQNDLFWKSLLNTFKMWGLNIILQIGLALGLVIIFSDLQYRVRGLGKFRTLFFLPNLIAAATVAVLFSQILNQTYGDVNRILLSFSDFIESFTGLTLIKEPIPWLEEAGYAQASVSIIQTWLWFGNTFILLMAGVQAIGKEYFEAAVIDGAGRIQILRKITLPLIKPILIYVAITSLIGGMQLFDIPYLLPDNKIGPSGSLQTVIGYVFSFTFDTSIKRFGYAAAVSYILFLILLVISAIFMYFTTVRKVKGAK